MSFLNLLYILLSIVSRKGKALPFSGILKKKAESTGNEKIWPGETQVCISVFFLLLLSVLFGFVFLRESHYVTLTVLELTK